MRQAVAIGTRRMRVRVEVVGFGVCSLPRHSCLVLGGPRAQAHRDCERTATCVCVCGALGRRRSRAQPGFRRMTFEDMLGWARLRRGAVCVSSLASVPRPRWDRFVASLQLDTPCEFGEGDVGMPGTVQTTEPANLHSTTEDSV